jgi:hypothetical protein
MEELKLVEDELASVRQRVETGLETPSATRPLQREILQLKQRLVRLRNEGDETNPPQRR